MSVLINPPWSPGRPTIYDKSASDEYDEIMLHLDAAGAHTEEIDEPKSPSIFPVIEYSVHAGRAAKELQDLILPILNKYRESKLGRSVEVNIRKRRATIESAVVAPRVWLHL